MAEIKSYADLEQSRKLAEFIPRDTADMSWQYQTDKWVGEPDYREWPEFEKNVSHCLLTTFAVMVHGIATPGYLFMNLN